MDKLISVRSIVLAAATVLTSLAFSPAASAHPTNGPVMGRQTMQTPKAGLTVRFQSIQHHDHVLLKQAGRAGAREGVRIGAASSRTSYTTYASTGRSAR